MTVDRHESSSKGPQVRLEPGPLQDSAYMGQTLLLGELEATPGEYKFTMKVRIIPRKGVAVNHIITTSFLKCKR